MGKHSGPAPEHPGRGRRLRFALAAIGTFLAWLVLVYLAIQIGSQLRQDGHSSTSAWVLLVIAVIGAVCCLFLALQLIGRVLDRHRWDATPDVAPVRPSGGHRARR